MFDFRSAFSAASSASFLKPSQRWSSCGPGEVDAARELCVRDSQELRYAVDERLLLPCLEFVAPCAPVTHRLRSGPRSNRRARCLRGPRSFLATPGLPPNERTDHPAVRSPSSRASEHCIYDHGRRAYDHGS
jgi:hypothetical protein